MTSKQLSEHWDSALRKGKTTLMSSSAVLELNATQLNTLFRKFKDGIVSDDHGITECPEYLLCQRVMEPTHDESLNYTRKHPDSKTRRGPYAKRGWSINGGYAQTTYSLKDHADAAKQGNFNKFPSMRTFQCTHIQLMRKSDSIPPPRDQFQLYNASHLCGFSDCVRQSHLVWERVDLNFARRMCHVYGAFEECPHKPSCFLRAPRDHFKETPNTQIIPPSFQGASTIS